MKRPDIRQILGDSLRLARQRAKLTQEQLAEIANVERSLISDIERGVSNPSLYFFVRLATALNTAPDLLLGRVMKDYVSGGGRVDDLPAGVKARGKPGPK